MLFRSAKFSENIGINKFEKFTTTGCIEGYIHSNNKLGVLLEVSVANPSEKSRGLIRDITMQIAAMNPQHIDRSVVTEEQIAKEIEIYKEIAIGEGKKPEIAERVAQGRLEKFFQDNCLTEQSFVKDSSKAIKDVLKEISTDMNAEVKVNKFLRFNLAEA